MRARTIAWSRVVVAPKRVGFETRRAKGARGRDCRGGCRAGVWRNERLTLRVGRRCARAEVDWEHEAPESDPIPHAGPFSCLRGCRLPGSSAPRTGYGDVYARGVSGFRAELSGWFAERFAWNYEERASMRTLLATRVPSRQVVYNGCVQ